MVWGQVQSIRGADRHHARSAPPVRSTGQPNANVIANRARFAAMSECERETGKTADELRAEMQAQRARVLSRYSIQAPA